MPLIRTWTAGSIHEISVAKEIDLGQGRRAVFTSWDDGGINSTRAISEGGEYLPVYKVQNYLTISSPYGQPEGEGWYDHGSGAPLYVEQFDGVLFRHHFISWAGDYNGTETATVIVMDSPKTVSVLWKSDFTRIYFLAGCLVLFIGIIVLLVKRGTIQLRRSK